ncbi:MAG: S41 family peptidase [Elusimicrobiota bacterium]
MSLLKMLSALLLLPALAQARPLEIPSLGGLKVPLAVSDAAFAPEKSLKLAAEEVPPIGEGREATAEDSPGFTEDQLLFIDEVAGKITDRYINTVDKKKLFAGALKGMTDQLDPKYRFKTPKFSAPKQGKAIEPENSYTFSEDQLLFINKVAQDIRKASGDSIDKKKLFYGAVKGMAAQLDHFSRFMDPEEYNAFDASLRGGYSGIGAAFEKKKIGKPLGILYAIPGSAAEEAGIKPGDQILSVGGQDVLNLDSDAVTGLVTGTEGSQVQLLVQRKDAEGRVETIPLAITRRKIEVPNLLAKMLPSGVGYVFITSFRPATKKGAKDSTTDLFLAEVQKMRSQGMRALVVDLRENGGGVPPVEMAAFFLNKEQNILSTKNKKGATQRWVVDRDGEFSDLPVAVLVNGHSASSSEIFAGALKDNKHAVVVGSRTYGKGSAQGIFKFQDGSVLKMTLEHWYTPSGQCIQKDEKGKGGITPDAVVPMNDASTAAVMDGIYRQMLNAPVENSPADPMLEKALELLK